MSQHLMLLPSLACPADCAYCFGPHKNGPGMDSATLDSIMNWQKTFTDQEDLEVTFHGGEPLLPGADFYRLALPRLRDGLFPRRVTFAAQSNLWPLNDELGSLFREFRVGLGTSLDGPEEINDAQRGPGHFKRTMAGIERARRHGLSIGCICTFTPRSARHAPEVFEFFANEELDFSFHAAAPALNENGKDGWILPPEAFGGLLAEMLDLYLANLERVRIPFLDSLCRSVSAGRSGLCTFSDCLGSHLAVGPDGRIYPCQRFAGRPRFSMGDVRDAPSFTALSGSKIWRILKDRQEEIEAECGDCPFLDLCRGGCPYNAMSANGVSFTGGLRDPYCPAYRKIFDTITDRGTHEIFSAENLDAVVERGGHEHGLLHKGRILPIMRGGPHPRQIVHQARKTVGMVALAVGPSAEEAIRKLQRIGLVKHPDHALGSLTALRERLLSESHRLVNNYIHVTYACRLSCEHCYARSGPHRTRDAMDAEDLIRLVRESAGAGFAKAVITGGEPLEHPQAEEMLDALDGLRREVKPMRTVLRTNLARPLNPRLMGMLAHGPDKIVVSLDGDEAGHDARRGAGAYARTTANLRRLLETEPSAEVSISAVLTGDQIKGREGDAVRRLGEELGIGIRFKPILPIGRAKGMPLVPEYYTSIEEDGEVGEKLARRLRPAATCGLGMNLYIAPDGECYPCYALLGDGHRLGNAFDAGLAAVLESKKFLGLKCINVDSNRQCRACALRYICGGFCRAWGKTDNPDGPPIECTELHKRALDLLRCALDSLNISTEHWMAAGLPMPDNPPREKGGNHAEKEFLLHLQAGSPKKSQRADQDPRQPERRAPVQVGGRSAGPDRG